MLLRLMDDLAEAARQAREHAYAPYSGYAVGAAVRDRDGRIWTGCNVENVAYPLSMCAERNAIAAMIVGGGREIREIALATLDGGAPCGACLQVLSEFTADPSALTVHLIREGNAVRSHTLAELLPYAFRSDKVDRTER